jgi:hypothetical protein
LCRSGAALLHLLNGLCCRSTVSAVRQYAWLFEDIKNRSVRDIVILSGDHL